MASLPRVVLVGGAPLCGKTRLAQAIACRLEIAHISTDDLSAAIRAITSVTSHSALHDPDVDGCFRDTYPSPAPECLLEDALAFHRAAWPAIAAVVVAHATWDRPALIEGWGVLPELLTEWGQERDLGALFVVPEEAVYERRCRANASFWKGVSDEEGLIRSFAKRSILFGRMIEHSAIEHGWPIVRPNPQTDLDEAVDLALGLLSGTGAG